MTHGKRAATVALCILCVAGKSQAQCWQTTLVSNADDGFGEAVAALAGRVAVGALGDDNPFTSAGAVHFFARSEAGREYSSTLRANNPAEFDVFGSSVALGSDFLVVGADHAVRPPGATGAVYFFRRAEQGWVQEQETFFAVGQPYEYGLLGAAVGIERTRALVGAANDDVIFNDAGAAYVFEREVDGTWPQVAQLVASDGWGNDNAGYAVALSGNVAVVGAPFHDHNGAWNSGAAYVFERDVAGTWIETAELTPTGSRSLDNFGLSIAFDGRTILVGGGFSARGNGGGAFAFERSVAAGGWVQTAEFTPDDALPGDLVGRAVAIDDGLALIGAPGSSRGALVTGAVYVYQREADATWSYVTTLLAPSRSAFDRFGESLSLSGNTAVISAWWTADERRANPPYVCIFNVSRDDDHDGMMDICECFGDVDLDGQVGLPDLARLLTSFHTPRAMTWMDGDLDLDGDVDLADLGLLLAHFGGDCL